VARNYKTKEFSVVAFVKEHFGHMDWSCDKMVEGGCSRRRPDMMLDLGEKLIIVEVDENQHVDYDSSCEIARLNQLSLDVGMRPIVYLRFNPDGYYNGAVKVKSCWCQNKQGICVVPKKREEEWNARLDVLGRRIAEWTDKSMGGEMIIMEHFFFDR
jgi:hypothetical protein